MAYAESNGTRIYYEDTGKGEPALVCLPGLFLPHTLFDPVARLLSGSHRLLQVDWRGHGKSSPYAEDFGFSEMLSDVLAVVQGSGARSVVPFTQAHGAWVALDMRRKLGPRVPSMVLCNWNPIFVSADPGQSPHPFLAAMDRLQDPAGWRPAADELVNMWVKDAPPSLETYIRAELREQGADDWSRGGREISARYAREGDPLRAMASLEPPPSVLHLYAQPKGAEYLDRQEAFARDHVWFKVRHLDAISHFPMFEVPAETAEAVRQFIG